MCAYPPNPRVRDDFVGRVGRAVLPFGAAAFGGGPKRKKPSPPLVKSRLVESRLVESRLERKREKERVLNVWR